MQFAAKLDDALRDRLIALPHDERRELERAIDDISGLNPDDWKEISTLPADDWDQLRGEIGDEISDTDWNGLAGWVDTMDEPSGDIDLDDVGVDDLDENLDIGGLEELDEGLDLGAGYDIEDVDLADVVGGAETMDLSDFAEGGYDGGPRHRRLGYWGRRLG